MTWLFFQILKFVFIVSAFMAYAEAGPGGDVLLKMVESTKSLILSVDYSSWWHGIVENLRAFSETASDAVAGSSVEGDE